MKKLFLPAVVMAMFAFSNAHAQAPITVRKSQDQVTKSPPISVGHGPAVIASPTTVKKTTTTKTTTTVTKAPAVHMQAPVKKTTVVKKTTIVKKTTTITPAARPHGHKLAAKKLKRLPAQAPPMAPPPPPPPVHEEVILPRPIAEPMVEKTERVQINTDDEDNNAGTEPKKEKCSGCHEKEDCMELLDYDQSWRFRYRHRSRYEYMNSFYDQHHGKDECKPKHKCCGDKEKEKHNDE